MLSDPCGRLPAVKVEPSERAVPTFTSTVRAGHQIGVETVEADEARVEGKCVVLADWRHVIFTPSRVATGRLRSASGCR